MDGNDGDVKSEKDEKLLIVFSDAIINPRAVMVHFTHTSEGWETENCGEILNDKCNFSSSCIFRSK